MSGYQPADEGWEERVRAAFGRQAALAHVGAELDAVAPGEADIALPFADHVTQHHGYFHGGVIGMIADVAGGFAGLSLMPPGQEVLTVEYKLNIVRPGRGDRLLARGRVVKPGRTLTITRADIVAEADGEESLIAVMQQTLIGVAGTSDVTA